jgi:hypothetical protein
MRHLTLIILVGIVIALSHQAVMAQTPPTSTQTPGPESTITITPTILPVSGTPTPVSGNIVEILIADALLNAPSASNSGPTTMAQAVRSLTLFADGKQCTSMSLTDASNRVSGGKLLVIPSSTTVPECRRLGAVITLVNEAGYELNETFTLEQGGRFTLAHFIPKAPATGGNWPIEPSTPEPLTPGISPPSTGSAGLGR